MNRLARTAFLTLPLGLSAVGIAVAIRFNDSNVRWLTALAGWTAGWFFALVAVAAWQTIRGWPVFGRPAPTQPRWRRFEVAVLAAVLVAAALLRMVGVESSPVALHNDEMSCLIEARGFLRAEAGLFSVGWFDCPNLGFFLTSLPARLFGPDLLTFRLTSAVFGLLSLVAVYLIVRRLFGVRPAMVLLLLTTPFHWHLHFSRTGFHYMQATALSAVAILLFAVAIDRRSPVIFGSAGVVAGVAWQTYYGAWLTPLILVAWAVAQLVGERERGKTAIKGIVIMLALFVITLVPLLAYYTTHRASATQRTTNVFILSEYNQRHVYASYGTSDPFSTLATNGLLLTGIFVGGGDDTSVQYGLQGRFIDPVLLAFFFVGLAYAVSLICTPGGQLLWIWFLGTMVAGGLLTIDAPFSPRLTGISPVLLLFPALLIDRLLRLRWVVERRWALAAAIAAAAAVLAFSTWWNLNTTFVRYPPMSNIQTRDFIVRLAAELDTVRVIANFGDREYFDHEAYRALVPGVIGKNMSRANKRVTDYVTTIRALGPRTLVVVPLGSSHFYGLCNLVGASGSGIVLTDHAFAGFEWCFVE